MSVQYTKTPTVKRVALVTSKTTRGKKEKLKTLKSTPIKKALPTTQKPSNAIPVFDTDFQEFETPLESDEYLPPLHFPKSNVGLCYFVHMYKSN